MTCHFIGRVGGPFGVLRRRIGCRFAASGATVIPCIMPHDRSRFCDTFRGACAVDGVSRLSGRGLVFLPLIIRINSKIGIYVARSSLRGCPKLCLSKTANNGDLANMRTPCPTDGHRKKRGGLRVVIRGHRGFVTGISKPHAFP